MASFQKRHTLFILLFGTLLFLFYIQKRDIPTQKIDASHDPPLWTSLNEKGRAFFNSGQYPEALTAFTQAYELRPEEEVLRKNLAQTHAQLGWEAIRNGKFADAEPHFTEAIQIFDQEASYYFGNALALHRRQKEDEALHSVERGLELDPNNSIGQKILGEIYYDRNELEKALASWEKAIQLDPHDSLLLARLEKIRREHPLFSHFQKEGTRHFNLLFEGREEGDLAREVLRLLESAYQEIGQAISYYPEKTVFAVLYTDQQFRDVTQSPAWTKALFDGKIHLPVGGAIQDEALLKKIVYHEFTHALVYQLSHGETPTWLNEGLALYFEEEQARGVGASKGRPHQPLIPLDQLHGSFMSYDELTARKAYTESRSAVSYLIERYGFFRIKLLLERLAAPSSFSKAFEEAFLISYTDFQKDWEKMVQD